MITNEQWESLEKAMDSLWFCAKFKLGKDEIDIEKSLYKGKEFKFVVYINGTIKGEWLIGENMPSCIHKVWWKRWRQVYNDRQKKAAIKIWKSKKRALENFPNLETKTPYYSCWFNSKQTLLSGYKKIDGLELLNFNK